MIYLFGRMKEAKLNIGAYISSHVPHGSYALEHQKQKVSAAKI